MQHQLLLDYEFATSQHGFIVRALIRLTGQAPATPASRVPLNIALVLDRSGSMQGEKLQAARDAAAFLVRRLAAEDRVSVVTYDHGVETLVSGAEGESHASLGRIIHDIESGGSTNLSGGWLRGRELVADARRDPGMNRVVLLTDGLANAGIVDPQQLTALAATAKGRGVTTTTIGFGEDYDEDLLRAMADAGGGNTYYIERPDQAPGVFEEEIEGLLSLAAQNVTVEIRPRDAARLTAIWNDYPASDTPLGRRLELGDVYAREPKSLLVEFFVPAIVETPDVEIAEVVVDAHVLTADGDVVRRTVSIPIRSPLSRAGQAEPVVREELLLLRAARAREESLQRRNRGDLDGASEVLRTMARELRTSSSANSPRVADQAADLSAMAEQLDEGAFGVAEAKYVAQRAYNVRRGKGMYEEKLRRGPRGR